MEESYFKERRRYLRIRACLDVRFHSENKNIEGRGFVCDISAKGLGIFAKQTLDAQEPLEIWIENPAREKSVYLKGRIIWSKPIDFSTYRIGIELEEVDLREVAGLLEIV